MPTRYIVRTGASGTKNTYKHMKTNDKKFACAKITYENVITHTEEKKIGNKDDGNNNREKNVSVNKKV